MLIELGIVGQDGSIIISLKQLDKLEGSLMIFDNRLWKVPS